MSSGNYKQAYGSNDTFGGIGKKQPGRSESSRGKIRSSQESTALPDNFDFFWSIDAVSINNCEPRYITLGNEKRNENATYWFPPIQTQDFTLSRRGKIFRWRAGNSTVFRDTKELQAYSVASVFIQARQNNFVATDVDCSDVNVKDRENGWCQIKFAYPEGTHKGLSEVNFSHKSGEHFTLAVPADGSSWMPQVIPEVYNRPKIGPIAYNGDISSSSGLCGNLALIVAMAAFSVHEDLAADTIAKCLGDHCWRKHNSGHGRYDERGVIARIFLRKANFAEDARHLRDYERGRYGAIFKFDPSCPTQAPRNSSQARVATSLRPMMAPYNGVDGFPATPSAAQSYQFTRQITTNSLPTTSSYGYYTRALVAEPRYAVPRYSGPEDPVPKDDYGDDDDDADDLEAQDGREEEQQVQSRMNGSSSEPRYRKNH